MLLKIVGVVFGLLVLVAVGLFGFIEATYVRDYGDTPRPAIVASSDPAVIARGEYVVHAVAHCSACHAPPEAAAQRKLAADLKDLRGGYALKAGPFGTFYPANLTADPATGLGAVDDATVARAIRHGVDRRGRFAAFMRIGVGPMSDADLTAVVSYLRTLPPVAHAVPDDEWGFIAKALSSKFVPRQDAPPVDVPPGPASVERGRYLAHGPAMCAGCHTPLDPTDGFAPLGADFSGDPEGEPDPFEDGWIIAAPNLTPHPDGIMTAWSEDQFVQRFRAGPAYQGSKMPWESFGKMTDDDVRSIYRYLRTLAPAEGAKGPSRRPTS